MRKILLPLVVVLGLTGPSTAADLFLDEPLPPITEPAGFEARWQFGMAAYAWLPSLSGTVGIGGSDPVDIDASFSDLLDYLDFAAMAVAEARYDRFGIFTDFMYTKLSGGGTGPADLISASVTEQMIVGTVMAEYQVVRQGGVSVDVMAGARVWGLKADVDVTLLGGDASGSGEEWWVDPMIGAKTRLQGASPWYVTAWGMIGGFGVSSDIDWDVFGGVGYEITDQISLIAGYRAVGVDYESGGLVFDIIQYGPVLGGVFRF